MYVCMYVSVYVLEEFIPNTDEPQQLYNTRLANLIIKTRFETQPLPTSWMNIFSEQEQSSRNKDNDNDLNKLSDCYSSEKK